MLMMYLANAALSLYRDDGTMVRFIAASPPDVPRDRGANEGGEKFTSSALNTFIVPVLGRS